MKRVMKSSLLVLLIGLSGCGQVGQTSENQKESISQEVAKTEAVNAKENTQEEVFKSLIEAYQTGEITDERLNESVKK